ncbi:hypothetical protein MOQ_003565 [Trypanosoma cruzi marinkellei]|uniref:Uncharacterized protein n=1 Tax=Trypanosoma cruzi marinkellei TaxID=85056 RepID=K2MZW9_TRYCR|nr:hypothetical protein MOQ_003565 [Trypanosoma cruzi marinkellei]
MGGDWLRAPSFGAVGPTFGRDGVARDITAKTDAVSNGGASPSEGPGIIVGIGISSIAAYVIYAMYRGSRRGPPQLFWTTPSAKKSRPPSNSHGKMGNDADDHVMRPSLTLVNFPKQMWGWFERSLRPLINAEELELRDARVVFFHDITEITPNNLEAVVRQEVLLAFEDLKGTPCAVYRSVVAVNGEPINPFWGAEEAVKASQGRALLERHCIGYTVDGGRVEILSHDTEGMVGAVNDFSAPMKTDLHVDDVDDALRRCFCANARTFSLGNEKRWDAMGDFSSRDPGKCISGPYARSFGVFWLSPVPLFAMLGAALRYSCAEFDGWRRLSEPDNDALSPFWMLRRMWQWWHERRESKLSVKKYECHPGDKFIVEIESLQDLTCIETTYGDLLKDAFKRARQSGVDIENIEIDTFPSAVGTVLRCSLRLGLTVFQALREAWRLTALVSCLKCDVQKFRLLVAVSLPEVCNSRVNLRDAHASWPHVQVFPVSREEAESSRPSFFSSAQYFRLLKDDDCVVPAEAFRRIQERNFHQLCYVVAEYVTGDFEGYLEECAGDGGANKAM